MKMMWRFGQLFQNCLFSKRFATSHEVSSFFIANHCKTCFRSHWTGIVSSARFWQSLRKYEFFFYFSPISLHRPDMFSKRLYLSIHGTSPSRDNFFSINSRVLWFTFMPWNFSVGTNMVFRKNNCRSSTFLSYDRLFSHL